MLYQVELQAHFLSMITELTEIVNMIIIGGDPSAGSPTDTL